MARKFTAQEIRFAVQRSICEDNIAEMLLQYADELEREKKFEYQYAARYFYPSGVIATDHIFDNPTDANCFSGSVDGAKKIICRREVGEWEEVPNDNN